MVKVRALWNDTKVFNVKQTNFDDEKRCGLPNVMHDEFVTIWIRKLKKKIAKTDDLLQVWKLVLHKIVIEPKTKDLIEFK